MADRSNFNPGCAQCLAVRMTGMLVLDRNDLTTIVRTTAPADKVRTLWLMTLRAFNRRDRVQYPICRAATARFATRRLPL